MADCIIAHGTRKTSDNRSIVLMPEGWGADHRRALRFVTKDDAQGYLDQQAKQCPAMLAGHTPQIVELKVGVEHQVGGVKVLEDYEPYEERPSPKVPLEQREIPQRRGPAPLWKGAAV